MVDGGTEPRGWEAFVVLGNGAGLPGRQLYRQRGAPGRFLGKEDGSAAQGCGRVGSRRRERRGSLSDMWDQNAPVVAAYMFEFDTRHRVVGPGLRSGPGRSPGAACISFLPLFLGKNPQRQETHAGWRGGSGTGRILHALSFSGSAVRCVGPKSLLP